MNSEGFPLQPLPRRTYYFVVEVLTGLKEKHRATTIDEPLPISSSWLEKFPFCLAEGLRAERATIRNSALSPSQVAQTVDEVTVTRTATD
jgi:hypothetical protein